MKNPVYKPTGKALEYAEFALNIYNGCPHGCAYCYAHGIARKTVDEFRQYKAREGLLKALNRQLQSAEFAGKTIHLCFMCDPFPYDTSDHSLTLASIREIHNAGANVQLLTKGAPGDELFSILKAGDKFGVSATCMETKAVEPYAAPMVRRLNILARAKMAGIQTFVSCEPVIDMKFIEALVKYVEYIDEFRIGKLNYNPELERDLRTGGYLDRSWGQFGRDIESLCIENKRKYLIKDNLRQEMNKEVPL